MSNQESISVPAEDDADEMDLGLRPLPVLSSSLAAVASGKSSLAILVRDATGWLPQIRSMRETDVIVLLTPVVIPISQDMTDTGDPFEPLGRALSKRHARVRQVPYTHRNGITSTHLGFIKRGHVIILCFAVAKDELIQVDFAEVAFAVSDNKPVVIIVCCGPIDIQQQIPFPTIIQTSGYSPPALEATAALIFGEHSQPLGNVSSELMHNQPRLWPVEQWDETKDVSKVRDLWNGCVSEQFALDQQTLASLLRRPGYAKHYVVRSTESGDILGFCATYLSYVDKEGENLVASVAILLVRPAHRQTGIGLSLHSHAINQLKRTRGVIRLQLGSTFPRILHGPPLDMALNEEWIRRRGWQLNRDAPGQGQAVYDLILNFADWRYVTNPPLSSCSYRTCIQADMTRVLGIVEQVSKEQIKMGWYDQYLSLMNGPNVKDVVMATDGELIVAVALTYTPSCGSQIASNLPWAGRIGNDVGGVTCICITDKPDTVLHGLLDACISNLQKQGMKKMFMDGVSDGANDFTQLGFREWAKYRDVWRDT